MPFDLNINATGFPGGGGGDPGPEADVVVDFGQFTRAGAGGVLVTGTAISSGDLQGFWQISGGRISPSATGQGAILGSYSLVLDNGQTVAITVRPGEYSARTTTEIATAFAHMTSAGGRTVTVRGETITAPNFTTLGPANTTFTSRATLRGEAGCRFNFAARIDGTRNITYRDFEVHRTDVPTGGENFNQNVVLSLEETDQTTILDNLVVHGRDLTPLGGQTYQASGSYNNWLAAIGSVSPFVSGITIRNCHLFDADYGIRLGLVGNNTHSVIVEDNLIEFTYTDLIQLSYVGTNSRDTATIFQRNVMTGPIGRPWAGGAAIFPGGNQGDQDDPHVDVLQIVPSAAVPSGSRITGFVFRQNVFWIDRARARGLLVQGLVSFNGLIWDDPIICGNFMSIDSTHAIVGPVDGGVINNNTLAASSTHPDLNLRNEISEINITVNGAAPVVSRNIVEGASTAGTITDEVVTGRQGSTIAFTTVFAGNDFATEPTSLADLVARFTRRVGGPADLGGAYDAGCFGSGYGTFGNPRSNGVGWSFNPDAEGATPAVSHTLTEMAFDGYVFDRDGSDLCPVILSGTGVAGTEIQVRGTSAGGDTAWQPTFVQPDGTWQATLLVPQAQWGEWYQPQARLGSSGAVVTGTNAFGCGDVVAFLGQSELEWILGNRAFYRGESNGAILNPPNLTEENLSVILRDDEFPPAITTHRITNSNLTDANNGCIAIANALSHILPGRKLMVVDLAHNGTSPFSLWNDDDGTRTWSVLEDTVNTARASGSDIGHVIMGWWSSPIASLPAMRQNWMPGMIGQFASGAAFTLGSTNTEGSNGFQTRVDHCFWDIEAAATERGRGIFSRARTKLHVMKPNYYYQRGPEISSEWGNFPKGDNGTPGGEYVTMNHTRRAGILPFVNDPRLSDFLVAYGPATHLARNDENNNGQNALHCNPSQPLGGPWFATMHMPAILRGAGMDVGEPTLTGTQVIDANTVDVIVSLPNGGNLTTIRQLNGIADPGSPPRQYQPVIGFQLQRGSSYRPIWRSGAGQDAAFTGSVVIQNTGTGSGSSRTGRARITLAQPIQTGNVISYGDGNANGILLPSRDDPLFLQFNMLIETVPAWRNGATLFPWHGIPVGAMISLPALTAP